MFSTVTKLFRRALAVGVTLGIVSSQVCVAASKDAVDFAGQIRPIISAKCYHCHGPDESSRKAKLRLDVREDATKARSDGTFPIKPGDLTHSELARRISSADP